MITSTPVAGWGWIVWDHGMPAPDACIRAHLDAYKILERNELVVGPSHVTIRVMEYGKLSSILSEQTSVLDPTNNANTVEKVIEVAEEASRKGRVGTVSCSTSCTSLIYDESQAVKTQPDAFRLYTDAGSDHYTLTLTTYVDAWMPYDTRGTAQPHTYSLNQPRLSTTLNEIARWFGDETDPEDPTRHGVPTTDGVENRFERDGSPSDTWSRYEEGNK